MPVDIEYEFWCEPAKFSKSGKLSHSLKFRVCALDSNVYEVRRDPPMIRLKDVSNLSTMLREIA